MEDPASKLRLTFIITDLDTGGAEMMLFRLLQGINRSIFDCRVINLSASGEVGEKILGLGIPVKNLGMSTRWVNPIRFFELIRTIRREKPHLVQTWMYHADLLGGLASFLNGVPVIWNIHNFTLHATSKWTTKLVVRINAQLSKIIPLVIITCSQAGKDYHIKMGYAPQHFLVIPNGFDTEFFKPDPAASGRIRKEFKIDPSTKIIGLVARFDPQKDHLTLIRASRLLFDKGFNVRFFLCGSQIDWQNHTLTDWIEQAGVKSSFILAGRRDDINLLAPGFDLLVSSSVGEAFPVAIGEAMACGIPCVATDAGDSKLIVGDTGKIVPPGSPELLANALAEMLSLPDRVRADNGKKARQRIIDQYNLPDIVSRYESCYLSFQRKM